MGSSFRSLTPEGIQAHLRTSVVGKRIGVHRQVGSTNDLAREAGRRGEPEGLVIVAEEQVAGRGRLGRTWTAPPGCCILCSVLLRPRFSPEQAFYLTIGASLAIYRAVHRFIGDSYWMSGAGLERSLPNTQHPAPAIKWPNDVLLNGRKLAGVLSESEFSGGDWAFSVIGFGINVNLHKEDLGELEQSATSLYIETGLIVDRAALLANVLSELDAIYLLLSGGQFGAVQSEWVEALETIGKDVTVQEGEGIFAGRAVGVDPDGALVLRLPDGRERRVLAGDVSLR